MGSSPAGATSNSQGALGSSESQGYGAGNGNGAGNTGSGLAYTGTNSARLVVPGVLLVLIGAALLIATRRRGAHQG